MSQNEFEINGGILRKYTGSSKEVVIPAGVTEIGSNAFCYSFVSKVIIPEGVVKINSNAFDECRCLQEVHFPDTVISIDQRAFSSCEQLRELALPSSLREIGEMSFLGCGVEELIIPEGVETIETMAFSYCASLRKIVLPKSLKAIMDNAFEGDVKIREVWVSSLEQWLALELDTEEANPLYPCKRVNYGGGKTDKREEGSLLYIGGKLVENLIIPTTFSNIRDYAFRGCVNLKDVTIPGDLEYIGEYAFCESGLRSLHISGKVGEIMDKAFFKCAELETIEFSSEPESIEQSAFKGCKSKPTYL